MKGRMSIPIIHAPGPTGQIGPPEDVDHGTDVEDEEQDDRRDDQEPDDQLPSSRSRSSSGWRHPSKRFPSKAIITICSGADMLSERTFRGAGCPHPIRATPTGSAWSPSQQRELSGPLHGVSPPAHAELAIHVPEVRLDGVDREVQPSAANPTLDYHRRQVAQDRLLALAPAAPGVAGCVSATAGARRSERRDPARRRTSGALIPLPDELDERGACSWAHPEEHPAVVVGRGELERTLERGPGCGLGREAPSSPDRRSSLEPL